MTLTAQQETHSLFLLLKERNCQMCHQTSRDCSKATTAIQKLQQTYVAVPPSLRLRRARDIKSFSDQQQTVATVEKIMAGIGGVLHDSEGLTVAYFSGEVR